jgi:hypothetical protein
MVIHEYFFARGIRECKAFYLSLDYATNQPLTIYTAHMRGTLLAVGSWTGRISMDETGRNGGYVAKAKTLP